MVGIVFDDGAAPFKVPEIETCIIELADVSVIIGYSIEYDFYPLIFIRIRSLNNRRMPGYFSDGGFERTFVADDPVIQFFVVYDHTVAKSVYHFMLESAFECE